MNRFRNVGAPVAGVLFALGATPARALQIDYSLDGGIEKNDNVALTSANPLDRTIFRTGLGFFINENTSTIQATFGGRIDYRDYRDSHLHNRTEGELAGRFNWSAIPQRLDFTVEDSLGIEPIDTLAPDSPGNRQQVNVVSAGPTLLFRMGATLRGQAEFRFINSDAEVNDTFNSNRSAVAFRAIKDFDTTSLASFNFQGQRVDFEHEGLARNYDLEEAYLGYSSKQRLLEFGIDAGYSRLHYRDGAGGSASEPLLRGNLRWKVSPESQVDFSASTRLTDSASAMLRELTPGSDIPADVLIGNAQITSSAFKSKTLDLGYSYSGVRLTFAVSGYRESRDYLDASVQSQRNEGASLNAAWRLSRTLTLDAHASSDTTDYRDTDRRDKTRYGGVGLQQDWSRHWSTRLEYSHYERTSNVPGQDVSQNVVYLSATYKNR